MEQHFEQDFDIADASVCVKQTLDALNENGYSDVLCSDLDAWVVEASNSVDHLGGHCFAELFQESRASLILPRKGKAIYMSLHFMSYSCYYF